MNDGPEHTAHELPRVATDVREGVRDMLCDIQSLAVSPTAHAALSNAADLGCRLVEAPNVIAASTRDGLVHQVERRGFSEHPHLPVKDLIQAHGVLAQVVQRGQAVRLEIASEDLLLLTGTMTGRSEPKLAFMGTPIAVHDIVYGALYFARPLDEGAFTEADETIANSIALQTAVALQHLMLIASERERTDRAETLRVRAESSERQQSDYLSMVSHDIKGPLSSIYGFAETLLARRDALAPEEQDAALQLITTQAQRIDRLVTGLLDLARSDAGALRMRSERVSMVELVEEVAREAAGDVEVSSMVVNVDDACVLGDPLRLTQVISNLVANAAKYGRPPVEIRIDKRRESVVVEVVDHGDGVPQKYRESMFDRFNPGARHIGLGLAIVKAFTEAHGGTVIYRDNEPYGARFVVTLPRARDER